MRDCYYQTEMKLRYLFFLRVVTGTPIQLYPMLLPQLSEELLINIIGFLNDEDLQLFGQTSRQFRQLSSNESVWKLMVLRQFGVSYKVQEESWKDMYERCKDDPRHNRICPHLSFISPRIVQRHYAHRYQAAIETKTKLTCNACRKHDESSLCFYMWPGRTRVCKLSSEAHWIILVQLAC